MPTYRLVVEYDGSKFSGWQVQRDQRTVQGVLLRTLTDVIDQGKLALQGAGRTDAGVHALAQVASLRCPKPMAVDRVLAQLARDLPSDVAVLSLEPAADSFHARHDAVGRCYRYQISRRRSAFGKRTTWWVSRPLDVERMRAAARHFVGRHDYRAFARPGHKAASTIVVVEDFRLWELADLVIARLTASHFLWAQARRMIGALVAVGSGAARPEEVPLWLSGQQTPPETAAPASGLFLEAVFYRGDERELPPPAPVGVPWQPVISGSPRSAPAKRPGTR